MKTVVQSALASILAGTVGGLALTDQPSASNLIAEYNRIDAHCDVQNKAFGEYMKPFKDRLEEIKNQLLAILNSQGGDSIKTDEGTAYKSTIMNIAIDANAPGYLNSEGQQVAGREALIDFALDNWDQVGNELLMVSAKKEAVRQWMDTHDGHPPPGLAISHFTRVNIRKA